jgi:Xaa-Pro aminopeptidase
VSPLQFIKSRKTQKELENLKNCHIRDGATLISFLSELKELVLNNIPITEYQAGELLDKRRMSSKNSKGLSFSTIMGYGPNGSIIHYRA